MAGTQNIEDLFDVHRCSSWWDVFPLVFYFPLGLVLALLRFFIGFHAFLIACVLPKLSSARCVILRVMCAVLGIMVKQEDVEHRSTSNRVIITNHSSLLDHLALDLVHPCILPGVWDLPKFLNWILGYKEMGVKEGRDVLIRNAKRHIREFSTPILAHPEGATTNGRVGLLKFSTWPFVLDQPVQPVILSATRPSFANVALSVLGSRWWSDLFWFLFVPCTVYSVRYLPPMNQDDDETSEEFSQRVQRCMAQNLSQTATPFTCSDKVELAKKILRENRPVFRTIAPISRHTRSLSSTPGVSSLQGGSELSRMAIRVKEVLPHVPLGVIRDDLVKTRCVDATIARLLEGVVSYQPEPDVVTTPSASNTPLRSSSTTTTWVVDSSSIKGSSNSILSGPILAVSAKTFGKTADERTQSYHERKAQLIKNARDRYIHKHGLVAAAAI